MSPPAAIPSPLDGALLMRSKGFAIFPLRTNEKVPAVKDWQAWALNATEVLIKDYGAMHPAANWGVFVGGTGHCVVDVDNKPGRVRGSDTLGELGKEKKTFPPTFIVKTTTGGYHIYFKGDLQNTTGALGAGIDTRGEGGYVVAPYSTIDAVPYTLFTDFQIETLPKWVKEKLSHRKPKHETNTPSIQGVDSAECLDEAINYLQYLAQPCIEGSSPGGEHLLQIFYEVRDRGVSKEKAGQLVAEFYNERCVPPWNFALSHDVVHFNAKLDNAYRYAQNKGIGLKTEEGKTLRACQDFFEDAQGATAGQMDRDGQSGADRQNTTGYQENERNATEQPRNGRYNAARGSELTDVQGVSATGGESGAHGPYQPAGNSSHAAFGNHEAEELGNEAKGAPMRPVAALPSPGLPLALSEFQGEAPQREWLIEGWLPKGEISSMYGKGGSGKSLLAMQLAYSVASATPFLGLKVASDMPVLAVFCEDSRDELHRRITSLRQAPEYEFIDNENTPLFFWPRVGEANDLARLNEHKTDVVFGAFRKPLEDALAKMPSGDKLLILDTLSDVYMGDENIRDQVNKFIKTHIGGLAKKYSLTVLLLAHPSRSGQNTGDMLSGSTAWENAVRNRLTLSKWEKSDDILSLRRAKSNYAKSGEEILVVWDEGRMRRAEENQIKEQALVADQRDLLIGLIESLPLNEEVPVFQAADLLLSSHPHLVLATSRATLARHIEACARKGTTLNGSTVVMVYKDPTDKDIRDPKKRAQRRFIRVEPSI